MVVWICIRWQDKEFNESDLHPSPSYRSHPSFLPADLTVGKIIISICETLNTTDDDDGHDMTVGGGGGIREKALCSLYAHAQLMYMCFKANKKKQENYNEMCPDGIIRRPHAPNNSEDNSKS